MKKVEVVNLNTGESVGTWAGFTPEDAVLSAYAQNRHGDYRMRSYQKNYGHLLTRKNNTISCGNYAAVLPKVGENHESS